MGIPTFQFGGKNVFKKLRSPKSGGDSLERLEISGKANGAEAERKEHGWKRNETADRMSRAALKTDWICTSFYDQH